MTSNPKYRAEHIASHLRKEFEEQKILSNDTYYIDKNKLEKMILYYGGKLELYQPISEQVNTIENDFPYIEKTGNDTFTICYKDEPDYLSILHELGHAFLDLENMFIGQRLPSKGTQINDVDAWLFARTLAMPREQFEKIAIKNDYNIQSIADTYKIGVYPVMLRGKDLHIWE